MDMLWAKDGLTWCDPRLTGRMVILRQKSETFPSKTWERLISPVDLQRKLFTAHNLNKVVLWRIQMGGRRVLGAVERKSMSTVKRWLIQPYIWVYFNQLYLTNHARNIRAAGSDSTSKRSLVATAGARVLRYCVYFILETFEHRKKAVLGYLSF